MIKLVLAILLIINVSSCSRVNDHKSTKDTALDDTIKTSQNPSIGYEQYMKMIEIDMDQVTAIGVLRYSGLTDNDNLFNFPTKYLLQSDSTSFYIVTDKNIDQYLGSCIQVKGVFPKGWNLNSKEINGRYTYGVSALKIDSIRPIKPDICDSFLQAIAYTAPASPPSDTLRGTMKYNKRPAPDIGYDYKIILDIPIPHPADETQKLSEITLVNTQLKLDQINHLIKDTVHIEIYGRVVGGYAESYHFILHDYKLIE